MDQKDSNEILQEDKLDQEIIDFLIGGKRELAVFGIYPLPRLGKYLNDLHYM
jgi:hypothetical protein